MYIKWWSGILKFNIPIFLYNIGMLKNETVYVVF